MQYRISCALEWNEPLSINETESLYELDFFIKSGAAASSQLNKKISITLY
jgi:hypothetical protein